MKQEDFEALLKRYGQADFMLIFNELSDENKEHVLKQADLLDFSMMRGLEQERQEKKKGVISPIKTLTIPEIITKSAAYEELGLQAIRAGKVAAVCLAGGMGTRLGRDCAKGICDIGITRKVYIFQRMIENIMEVVRKAGVYIPIYIMTSYLNDAETRDFFREMKYFGYDPDYVSFFVQDMSPCMDSNKKMILESADTMAMSPNGNGGFYSSMITAGIDRKATQSGVEFLNVFAVDNVLQKIADPVFIGATIDSGCDTGAKVVCKADPDEKVGVICLEDGEPSVVEYYEMTDELRNTLDETGKPVYNYGVILNYLFRLRSIDKVVRNSLPVHVVRKKIPYFDGTGRVKPSEPNGYKLETLVLDLVRLTGTCLPFEVDRKYEFAPIKNAEGVDSVESARRMLEEVGYKL